MKASDYYCSPIRVTLDSIQSSIETDITNYVIQVTQSYGVTVDKEELIAALQYDRKQFQAGFKAGYEAGAADVDADLKQLLSFAIQDIQTLINTPHPENCRGIAISRILEFEGLSGRLDLGNFWRYYDEAQKLLGGTEE